MQKLLNQKYKASYRVRDPMLAILAKRHLFHQVRIRLGSTDSAALLSLFAPK